MESNPLPPYWEKAKIISSILIPFALLAVGNWYSNAIKERDIQAKYVELAIGILNSETAGNYRTKDWAVNVINTFAPIKIDSLTRKEIIKNGSISNIVETELTKAGYSLAQNGEYKAAIEKYNQAIAQNATTPEPYQLKAYALYRSQKYQQALEMLNESLKFDTNYPWSHYTLALVQYKLGNTDSAMNEVETFLHLLPSYKWYMKGDSEFRSFQSIPRFNELMK